MKTKAIIEIGKDMTYDVYTDDEKLGFMVMGQGKTISEAKSDFLESVKEMSDLFHEERKEFDFEHLEFEYVYEITSFLKYSPFTLTWLASATGINVKQLSHYTTGVRQPSRATREKIQMAVLAFTKDYQQVSFVES